jgi:hypothetical protein
MPWTEIINELGGGVAAVAIVGLSFAWWYERKHNTENQKLTLEREVATQVLLNRVLDVLRRLEDRL